MASIGPVSSVKDGCCVAGSGDFFVGEGGSGTFDGDLGGDWRFESRSPRGCLVFVGEVMFKLWFEFDVLRRRTC